MELPSRRRRGRGAGNPGFQKTDFGNLQAKSEAIQRVFGLEEVSLGHAVGRARKLSGIDRFLGHGNLEPAGLGNWDNSCYQNSVIQSLASLSTFNHFLAQSMERMSEDDAAHTHDELMSIIGRLNHLDNRGRRLWTPAVLKSMDSWQQQDAQEYFSKIIDEVDREISKFAKQQCTDPGFRRPADIAEPLRLWQPNPFRGLLAQRVGCTQCGYTEGLSLLPFTCITVNLGHQWECDIRDCLDEYTALESIEGVECIKCTILRTRASLQQALLNIGDDLPSKALAAANSNSAPALRKTVTERLKVISEVIEAGDFSDSGLYKKCVIPVKSRVSTTKSKQVTVARAPNDLVVHVNRSIFEATGIQRKNHTRVRFPLRLNLKRWCLGSDCVGTGEELRETWNTSPTESMLSNQGAESSGIERPYQLRSVITHYGGHENGHYIAYRRQESAPTGANTPETEVKQPAESWHCFNDDIVSRVSEEHVLSQGGVFMLFYEATRETEQCPPRFTPPLVNEAIMADRQTNLESSQSEEEDVEDLPQEGNEDHRGSESSQIFSGVDLITESLTEIDRPPLSFSSPEPALSTEDLTSHTQLGRPTPQSLAPFMRTAGAPPTNSRKGRRSSNISIHSPSFITAS